VIFYEVSENFYEVSNIFYENSEIFYEVSENFYEYSEICYEISNSQMCKYYKIKDNQQLSINSNLCIFILHSANSYH